MLTTSDSIETIYADIDMLRAELRNCLDRDERRQIEAEFAAARTALSTHRYVGDELQ
jgi:hypothetical protein